MRTQLSCKLTSTELKKRKEDVIAMLREQMIEKKELTEGYCYKFNGTDEILEMLTLFIRSERQCCGFFNFRLSVNNDSFTWLEISGPEGTKKFITAELKM
jgi:hypothetical protein